MSIDPSDSTTAEPSAFHQFYDFRMRDRRCSMHFCISSKKSRASTTLPDQELAVDEIVGQDFVVGEKLIQLGSVRLFPSQKADPDRRIHQDHQAARRLRAVLSRRRGTSRAPGSEPRKARRRS